MAYVTEEIIKAARAGIKQLNKQYGVKATVSGLHTSTLKLTISEGCIDFISSYIETCNLNLGIGTWVKSK